VLKLWGDIEELEEVEGLQVYQKSTYILDGFKECKVTDVVVLETWDIWAEKAWQCCDMVRAYWFNQKALKHIHRMYGEPKDGRPDRMNGTQPKNVRS
jgi:hypothetical protein